MDSSKPSADPTGQFSQWIQNNRVLLRVYDPGSPLLEKALSEQVFRYMIDFWQADQAWLTEESYRDAVWDDTTLEQLGWLNYRSDPGYGRFLPRSVQQESHGNGLFFRIGDGRVLSNQDLNEVQIGQSIQSAIRASRAQ